MSHNDLSSSTWHGVPFQAFSSLRHSGSTKKRPISIFKGRKLRFSISSLCPVLGNRWNDNNFKIQIQTTKTVNSQSQSCQIYLDPGSCNSRTWTVKFDIKVPTAISVSAFESNGGCTVSVSAAFSLRGVWSGGHKWARATAVITSYCPEVSGTTATVKLRNQWKTRLILASAW